MRLKGHGRVEQLQPLFGARPARIRLPRRRLLGLRQHRLEALPVRHRTQRGIRRHEVVEVGRTSAREPSDDDRPVDDHAADLRMPGQELSEQETVLEEPDELLLGHEHPDPPQAGLGSQRAAQDLERLTEAIVAEVGETGLGRRRVAQRVRLEADALCHRGHHREDFLHLRRELGVGEVVDANGRRPPLLAHQADPAWATGTTRVVGRSGVATGWNHRNQIRPRRWPEVEIQFGWPGSRWEMTTVQDPSSLYVIWLPLIVTRSYS
jgi:hypothetical protein